MRIFTLAMLALMTFGCGQPNVEITNRPPEKKAATAKLKTTQDVKEFDPAADNEVIEPDVKMSNPITGALEAYEPLKEKVAGLGVDHSIRLFHALEGRYPKTHDEFMQRIIRDNNLRLPNLPDDREYQYDVANHKLLVVRKTP